MKRRYPWGIRCGAKRTNGEPCRSFALFGCTRCRLHGGLTPKAQAKAPERIELVARAAVQPAIDTVIAAMTTGPKRKRLAVALAVLVNAGAFDEESASVIERSCSMEVHNPLAESTTDAEE